MAPWVQRALLATYLLAICLLGLGSPEAGSHPDEATYLAISAEMADRGAWLTATLEGDPNFYKPPLLYWAARVCFALFGQTLFAGRLGVALCVVALALLLAALARRLYGQSAELPAA